MGNNKLGKIAFFKVRKLENSESEKIKKLEARVEELENRLAGLAFWSLKYYDMYEKYPNHVHTYADKDGNIVDTGGVK